MEKKESAARKGLCVGMALALAAALGSGSALALEDGAAKSGANVELTIGADAGGDSAPASQPESNVTILAGYTQFDTSAAQALHAFPEGSAYAIVASGIVPADALCAAPLAGALDCPILLTDKEELATSVQEALEQLKVEQVLIIGGEGIITKQVESQLPKSVKSVERIAGETQYDTQIDVFEYGRSKGFWADASTVILASGNAASAADALSISPYAFVTKTPVFFVDSQGRIPSSAQIALVNETKCTRAIIVGGTAVVSKVAYGFLDGLTWMNGGSSNVVRLAGETLYDTSAAVAAWSVQEGVLSWNNLAFSTGRVPFDALGGCAVQGHDKAVLLLADEGASAPLSEAVAHKGEARKVKFFGGEAVMPESLRTTLCEALGVKEFDEQQPSEDGEGTGGSGGAGAEGSGSGGEQGTEGSGSGGEQGAQGEQGAGGGGEQGAPEGAANAKDAKGLITYEG